MDTSNTDEDKDDVITPLDHRTKDCRAANAWIERRGVDYQ